MKVSRILIAACVILGVVAGVWMVLRARIDDTELLTAGDVREGDVTTQDGVRLHYWFYDRGTSTVVLKLHGGPGGTSAASRAYFGATLADAFGSVLYFDQRGCGASERDVDAATFTFARAVHDIDDVRSAVIPGHPVVVDGGSFGAMLAVAYGAESGDNVVGYILTSPAMDMRGQSPGYAQFTQEQLATNASDTNVADAAIAPYVHENDPAWDSSNQQDIAAMWSANEHFDTMTVLPLLTRIADKPVLVVSGDSDPLVTPEEVDAMRLYLPHATFVEVPHAGHNFAIAHADEYLSALRAFFATLPKQ